jgi:G6PDH family F420-dependent oxidoreductase
VWDRPDDGVELAVAVSGAESVERFATLADHLIAVEPDAELVRGWADERSRARFGPSRAIGQIPISWDPDRDTAISRAHEQFRWFGLGWPVNANLPTTEAFASASQFVRPEDVADAIPCGPDLDAVVEAVSAYWEAGFTDVALVQIGDEKQQEFLDVAAGPLLAALRAAAPADGAAS